MHKIISKTLCRALVLSIAAFLAAGQTMAADVCQDQCTVDTKFEDIIVKILPGANDQWPIVVNAPGGDYSCGDPANYPCLAWPYQCFSGDCSLITKGSLLIPNCCDKPIEILWTSQGSPANNIFYCDQNPQSSFPNVCSGYELQLNNTSGGNPGTIFWFTTPVDIGKNMIDITFPIQSKPKTCLTGIKGPGCNTPIPTVRVEPRIQCYQFIADVPGCQKAQTWYAKWAGTDPCAVDVWVAESADPNGFVPCEDFPNGFTPLEGEELGTIQLEVAPGVWQPLSEALTNNSACNEGWLRFINEQTGCNVRCYYSGGKKYCY